MSRRESRSSIGARQNDALFEFENFKKKFLLANKHITKLNSTLSVRIEELNAQISTLYVENLRLRASEIALAAELKREREKSHQVLADAEAASQSLAKHLSYLRESHNIRPPPSTSQSPPSPRARRPAVDPTASPTSPLFNRISRPPNVPGIYEEEEPGSSSNENDKQSTTPRKKSKTKPRLSASKLPLPTRSASPTRSATPAPSSSSIPPPVKSRKTLRRPSGLLEINTEALSVPRAASPAFGSPIRLEAGRAEEAEEYEAVHGNVELVVIDQDEAESLSKKEKKRGKAKEQRGSESEDMVLTDTKPRSREKRKPRDEIDFVDVAKPKPKDTAVQRTALQPIDSNVHEIIDVESMASSKLFLRPISPASSGPNSRGSSSPAPPGSSEAEGGGARERRTRKSVNYAEPKLNTKMRKPESVPGFSEPARKKRSSAAAVVSSSSYKPPSSPPPPNGEDTGNDHNRDNDARSSRDTVFLPALPILPLRATNGGYIDPENFPLPPSRPGSAAAMYSPGPPTRVTGSTTSGSSIGSSTSFSSNTSSSMAIKPMKQKKSRPQLVLSDEEQVDDSDGAEADEEYIGAGARAKGGSWVNLDGRRKALPKRSAATAAVAALEDIRRHSMAI